MCRLWCRSCCDGIWSEFGKCKSGKESLRSNWCRSNVDFVSYGYWFDFDWISSVISLFGGRSGFDKY